MDWAAAILRSQARYSASLPGFTRVLMTAETGAGFRPPSSSRTIWTSSRPIRNGAAPSMRVWRSLEAEPALRVLHGVEALQDDPVDLQWRIGRHQPLLDEAREARDHVAGLALPAGEVLGSLRPYAGLGDDADGHLALVSPAAEQAVGREGQVGEAHAGGVGQRIRHRRRHRVDAALALGLGAQRTDRVDRVGEEDVGMRRVGEGRDAAVAQLRVHHVALVVDHVLDQRPAVAHGDRAVELAAALHGVDRPADVGRMHAVQDADLAGHAMHREPHALHVEGDGARRQVSPAADREAVVDLGAGGMELGERDPLVAADDRVVLEPALVDDDAGVAAGEVEDVGLHRLGGEPAPPCRPRRCRCWRRCRCRRACGRCRH